MRPHNTSFGGENEENVNFTWKHWHILSSDCKYSGKCLLLCCMSVTTYLTWLEFRPCYKGHLCAADCINCWYDEMRAYSFNKYQWYCYVWVNIIIIFHVRIYQIDYKKIWVSNKLTNGRQCKYEEDLLWLNILFKISPREGRGQSSR